MKPAPSRRALALLAAALAASLSACATVDVASERYLGVPQVAPTAPASVEILRREPKRPHVRLGEVFLSPSDGAKTDEIEKALREEAAKLGAEAAVVVQDRTKRIGTYVTGGWWVRYHTPIYGRQIVAVAIRYEKG
ncbi:MAG: hypothetical protein U0529_21795 [Thermoanaerobaculia bacterium]